MLACTLSLRADEARLKQDVVALAEGIGPRTVFRDDSLGRAADYVAKRFESSGWTVRRQGFTADGVHCENLEVERRGREQPEEIVVIGAHYDTVTTTPGADDNASGVAVLLALAEHFATNETDRTLRFVAFANEEPVYFQTEFMGSRVYARECKRRGERVVAMLSLESLGYFSEEEDSQRYPFPLNLLYPSRGNFIAVVGNRDSRALVKQVAERFAAIGSLPCESAALPGSLPGIGWSDHWSFWQEGFPAVMITDTAVYRNPNYHRAGDTPDTLDYPRLRKVAEGLQAVVHDLVNTR